MLTRRTSDYGMTEYRSKNWYHRPNGPAVISKDGATYWWMNGRPHRYYGHAYNLKPTWVIHGYQIKP